MTNILFNSVAGADISKKSSPGPPQAEPADPLTELNTRINAKLYHTSDETVDLYRQENTNSDLLGRLYYDDYDSSAPSSAFMTPRQSTPIPVTSPDETVQASSDPLFFSSPLKESGTENAVAQCPPPPDQDLEHTIAFDNTYSARMSVTHKVKHPQFRFRRNNKTYLAAHNSTEPLEKAIEWVIDEMMVTGDTVIVLKVLDERHYSSIDKEKVMKQLHELQQLNKHHKKISMVYEVVIGDPEKVLRQAIKEYNPAMMALGTRHGGDREHRKFMQKQSFLRHLLERALVPVIIVKATHTRVELLERPIDGPRYFMEMLIKASKSVSESYDGSMSPTRHFRSPLARCDDEDRGRTASKAEGETPDHKLWFTRSLSSRSRSRSRLALAQRGASRIASWLSSR